MRKPRQYEVKTSFLKKVLLMISIMLLLTVFLSAKELICVCENVNDFPTVIGDSEKILDTNPGMGIEAVYLLEKKLGVKITIKRLPWKRCLQELKTGKADLLFTASFKEKRKEIGKYPEINGKVDPNRKFSSSSYAFYKLKSSPLDFTGKNYSTFTKLVGAPRGYSIVEDLKKKGLKIDEGPSTLIDFKKLMNNRIQAVAALELTGDFYLTSNPDLSAKIEKMKPLITEKPYYFMISHQFYNSNKELSEKVWDTIAEIREDPDFKKKLKNYLK